MADEPVNSIPCVPPCAAQGFGMTLENVGSLLEPYIVFMWQICRIDFFIVRYVKNAICYQ